MSIVKRTLSIAMACVLMLIGVGALGVSAHAASTGESFTLGGVSGSWSVSCTSTGGSSEISFNSMNSSLSTTLTYYYALDTNNSTTIYSYGPSSAAGNGYASKSFSRPGNNYRSYRSVASFTATYGGDSINLYNKQVYF